MFKKCLLKLHRYQNTKQLNLKKEATEKFKNQLNGD